jgi:hypothetical protein
MKEDNQTDPVAAAIFAYSKTGASKAEILELLEMSEHQFSTYSKVYESGFNQFKHMIRKSQLTHSTENANMAIWLGKQYLNQRDFKDDGSEMNKVVDEAVGLAMQELLKDYELTPIKRRPTNVRKIK